MYAFSSPLFAVNAATKRRKKSLLSLIVHSSRADDNPDYCVRAITASCERESEREECY